MVRRCCILVLLSCLQLTLAKASTPSPVSKTASDPSEDLDGAQNEDQVLYICSRRIKRREKPFMELKGCMHGTSFLLPAKQSYAKTAVT